MNEIREIKPTAIYSEDELTRLLGGFTTIETLKQKRGLVGSFETGYWGRNVIASIDRMVDDLQTPSGKKR